MIADLLVELAQVAPGLGLLVMLGVEGVRWRRAGDGVRSAADDLRHVIERSQASMAADAALRARLEDLEAKLRAAPRCPYCESREALDASDAADTAYRGKQ